MKRLLIVVLLAVGCAPPVSPDTERHEVGYGVLVWHDDARSNTCYLSRVYGGYSISCVADHP